MGAPSAGRAYQTAPRPVGAGGDDGAKKSRQGTPLPPHGPRQCDDARHTAATLLLTHGVPARVAMAILGHSQISLTLGTYSRVAAELATEAAARMGAALWRTETRTEPRPSGRVPER